MQNCRYGPLKLWSTIYDKVKATRVKTSHITTECVVKKKKKRAFANKPGLFCTMTAGVADWKKVALWVVRGRCGQAGPCGGLEEGAVWAGPHSETPAWAGWCAGAGRGAVCAGCESGSCGGEEEAPRTGETAEKGIRESIFSNSISYVLCHYYSAFKRTGVTNNINKGAVQFSKLWLCDSEPAWTKQKLPLVWNSWCQSRRKTTLLDMTFRNSKNLSLNTCPTQLLSLRSRTNQ